MNIDSEVLDSTVYRLLGKAGLDPRCTPNILRAKTEQKMKLEKDQLLLYRMRIKKLIIKWWRDTQMTGSSGEKRSITATPDGSSKKKLKSESASESSSSAQPDLDILRKYKAWRQYTKALKRNDLLEGLTEISEIAEKVSELRRRLSTNGFQSNSVPTDAEITEAESKNANNA